jgi:hypothetical protein
MTHLWRDPDSGKYGLQQLRRPDGTYDTVAGLIWTHEHFGPRLAALEQQRLARSRDLIRSRASAPCPRCARCSTTR